MNAESNVTVLLISPRAVAHGAVQRPLARCSVSSGKQEEDLRHLPLLVVLSQNLLQFLTHHLAEEGEEGYLQKRLLFER